jgi:hypothetical protein
MGTLRESKAGILGGSNGALGGATETDLERGFMTGIDPDDDASSRDYRWSDPNRDGMVDDDQADDFTPGFLGRPTGYAR